MEKLVVCIMGQDCEKFIGMCLESVKDADAIVFCDGGSTDNTLQILDKNKFNDIEDNGELHPKSERIIIRNDYDQKDKGMNGKQRNFYLKYIKEYYPNDWCLFCDTDEVVEDLSKIKKVIQVLEPALYNVRMRHFIGDLGHEDATQQKHYVLGRLFKISEAEGYPEVEHPVLQGKGYGQVDDTTIWHLSYIPNLWEIKKKYDNHSKKSNIHSPQFLRSWYISHILGQYPKKRINAMEVPNIIWKEFGVDKDELYVMGRENMEVKHYQDAIDWTKFFKPKNCTIYGCGVGQRVYTMNCQGVDTIGIEINPYAVKLMKHDQVKEGDIREDVLISDLVIAFDVLEHIDYEDIDKAINTMIKASNKHILISVPVLGNPQLELDSTHLIKESEEWWINKFTEKGVKLIKTPEHFGFKEQVYIFEK